MPVFGEPIAALGMLLKDEYPDETELKEFAEMVKTEFMTLNFPVYVKL
jgi:hypothetical protein